MAYEYRKNYTSASEEARLFDAALQEWNERAPGDWRQFDSGDCDGFESFDTAILLELANARMPFGKYAGRLLIDLPEGYVVWFSQKGFPKGEIGRQLASLFVIKENGMEPLLRPLIK